MIVRMVLLKLIERMLVRGRGWKRRWEVRRLEIRRVRARRNRIRRRLRAVPARTVGKVIGSLLEETERSSSSAAYMCTASENRVSRGLLLCLSIFVSAARVRATPFR